MLPSTVCSLLHAAAYAAVMLAECIPGSSSITGPTSGSVCATALNRAFTYRVSSGRRGVNVESVTASAQGVSCSVSPSASSKLPSVHSWCLARQQLTQTPQKKTNSSSTVPAVAASAADAASMW